MRVATPSARAAWMIASQLAVACSRLMFRLRWLKVSVVESTSATVG